MKIFNTLFLIIAIFSACSSPDETKNPPNLILIITDDQGYGDLAAHGNAHIQTPHMDQLHQESIRFTDFHVATTCAPTRVGLLTGRNCHRAGIWHTIMGRSLLWPGVPTMADFFAENGYETGIFGKWHLGDNYPFRPQDRGFQEVLVHGGGGIWQLPDYWNNDYFDDTYFHNGEPEKYTGYCTDIWFENALNFIKENDEKGTPFFCYLSTNAPHGPYHVPQKYIDRYANNPDIPNPNFYGMITNVDENLGVLEQKLKEWDLYENTILIFMTDNGTAAGVNLDRHGFPMQGYNAGMRGKKGSEYDGGHRVPFFIRWPAQNLVGGKDIDEIAYYADVLPTLLDLCNAEVAENASFDGASLKPLLQGKMDDWQERILIVDTQREDKMVKGKNSAVMTNQWRLIRGKELYQIEEDPAQKNDIASQYPEIVDQLNEAYDQWWENVSIHNEDYARIEIGSEFENPVDLTAHDTHPFENGYPAWNQTAVRRGTGQNGFWAVDVKMEGNYQISLLRWPMEAKTQLLDSLSAGDDVPGGEPTPPGKALEIRSGYVQIGDIFLEKEVDSSSFSLDFEVNLTTGPKKLVASFKTENDTLSAYYVRVTQLEE